MAEVQQRFSGWRVLAGCFLVMFLVQGGLQTFAIYLPSIAEETGWGVPAVAIVSTTATVGAFLANLVISRFIEKLSAKWVLFIGTLFLCGHWLLYSVSLNKYMLWFAGFLGGIAIGFGTVAPCSIIMTNWFVKNRSQYVAAVIAASMFGSTILNPLAGQLIARFGWRHAYQVQALTVGLIAVLVVLLLVIDGPERVNQRAYGALEAGASADAQAAVVTGGIEASAARKTASFWLMILGIFLIGLSTNIENYIPAFWQSRGMSAVTSSSIMGVYAFIAAVGSIIMSKVNDKLGGKNFVLITSILFAISTLVMAFTGVVSALPLLIIVCIPFAIGSKKASGLIPPLVVAEAFGRKYYAQIIGSFTAMLQLGIAASNPIIGAMLNSSGGYNLPFTAMVVVNLVGMALIFIALVRKPYRE